MDGIRRQLISNYNNLLYKISESTDKEGEVRINLKEISNELEQLRQLISILCYCKIDGEFDFIEDFELLEINEIYL